MHFHIFEIFVIHVLFFQGECILYKNQSHKQIKISLFTINTKANKSIVCLCVNTMCQKCDTELKGELKLGEIITFDLNGAADSVLLTELPITLSIKDNYYFLVGTI